MTIITASRVLIRAHYNINGNPVEDFFAVMLLYPSVMTQMSSVSRSKGLSPLMPDGPKQPNFLLIENKAVQIENETEA